MAEVLQLLQQLSDTQNKPDPTRITTCSEAIKYVAKYVSRDDYILERIRHMIEEQARREQEWLDQRIKVEESNRKQASNRQELERILRLINNPDDNSSSDPDRNSPSHSNSSAGPGSTLITSTDTPVELASYDATVYRSLENLMRSQSDILSELKIPLFCCPPSVRVSNDDKAKVIELLRHLAV